MTSSWFFLSTLNYDARSTTHQIHNIFAEGHPYHFQFKHIFMNVTVPSLSLFYHNGVIQFQSKHFTVCCMVQECLSLQNDVKLTDWPPQLPASMAFPHHRVKWSSIASHTTTSFLIPVPTSYCTACWVVLKLEAYCSKLFI